MSDFCCDHDPKKDCCNHEHKKQCCPKCHFECDRICPKCGCVCDLDCHKCLNCGHHFDDQHECFKCHWKF